MVSYIYSETCETHFIAGECLRYFSAAKMIFI